MPCSTRDEPAEVRRRVASILSETPDQDCADALLEVLARGDAAIDRDVIDALDRLRARDPALLFGPDAVRAAAGRERARLAAARTRAEGLWLFKLFGLLVPGQDFARAGQNSPAGPSARRPMRWSSLTMCCPSIGRSWRCPSWNAWPGQGRRHEKPLGPFRGLRENAGEQVPAALRLSAYFFFVTAAASIVKVSKTSLFLNGSPDRLPFAYLISAVVMGFIVVFNARFLQRLPLRTSILGSLGFFFAGLVLLRLLLPGHPRERRLMILFWLWGEIFLVMSVAQFWILANEIFPRAGSKLWSARSSRPAFWAASPDRWPPPGWPALWAR